MRELLNRIDATELSEWQAFQRIEGTIGEERADLRMGILASLYANAHLREGAAKARPVDFMPFADKSQPKQSIEHMKDMLRLAEQVG